MPLSLTFITPREFQVASIDATVDRETGEARVSVTPLAASKKQETTLVGHLMVVNDAGERAYYDLRVRVAELAAIHIRPVSGKTPPRRTRRTRPIEERPAT